MIVRRRSELLKWLPILSNGKIPILTNGCFDLLHYGHIKHLRNMMHPNDPCYLRIVALNSDYSVLEYKGQLPVVEEMDRAVALDELDFIDIVYIFSEPDPGSVLRDIKPHFYFKGGDWGSPEDLPEYEICQQLGIIVRIDKTEGSMRSSEIKQRIKDV